jgi:hypothetical protein
MAPVDSLARLRKALIDPAERGEAPVTQATAGRAERGLRLLPTG